MSPKILDRSNKDYRPWLWENRLWRNAISIAIVLVALRFAHIYSIKDLVFSIYSEGVHIILYLMLASNIVELVCHLVLCIYQSRHMHGITPVHQLFDLALNEHLRYCSALALNCPDKYTFKLLSAIWAILRKRSVDYDSKELALMFAEAHLVYAAIGQDALTPQQSARWGFLRSEAQARRYRLPLYEQRR